MAQEGITLAARLSEIIDKYMDRYKAVGKELKRQLRENEAFREELEKAVYEGGNIKEKFKEIFKKHGISRIVIAAFDSAFTEEDLLKLSEEMRKAWKSPEGQVIKARLKRTATGIKELYKLAALGKYNELAQALGTSEVPKNYAEALALIARVKRLGSAYTTVWTR